MNLSDRETSQQIYRARINRVIDYISENLAEELALKQLAAVANFSEFHFHRLFRSLMNEPLNEFITRLRLEKAILLMRRQKRPSAPLSLTDIAVECGFNSLSNFSRTFKKHYGESPGKIDLTAFLKNSKIGQTFAHESRYYLQDFPAEEWQMDFPVRVVNQPPRRIAYVRCLGLHLDPAQGVAAYQRLMQWARDRAVLTPATLVIGRSPDNPEITPLDKYRYDLCVTVGEHIKAEAEINVTTMPATSFAMHHCVGDIHQVERAWHYFFKVWLPGSGYQPASLPALEIFLKLPEEIGWDSFDLECCVPVERL